MATLCNCPKNRPHQHATDFQSVKLAHLLSYILFAYFSSGLLKNILNVRKILLCKMGRSKFPGKPSKLVNKKRVSVLNGVSSGSFGDSNEDDADDLANDQVSLSSTENDTTTTTTPQPSATTSSGHDGDAQVIT